MSRNSLWKSNGNLNLRRPQRAKTTCITMICIWRERKDIWMHYLLWELFGVTHLNWTAEIPETYCWWPSLGTLRPPLRCVRYPGVEGSHAIRQSWVFLTSRSPSSHLGTEDYEDYPTTCFLLDDYNGGHVTSWRSSGTSFCSFMQTLTQCPSSQWESKQWSDVIICGVTHKPLITCKVIQTLQSFISTAYLLIFRIILQDFSVWKKWEECSPSLVM